MLPGKYLAGGLQSGCIVNLIGTQYTLLPVLFAALSYIDNHKRKQHPALRKSDAISFI